MLDFTDVEKEMIKDIKELYLPHYIILNHLSLIPKEVNLIIVYNMILTSELLRILEKDIVYSYKTSLHFLIVHASFQDDIKI